MANSAHEGRREREREREQLKQRGNTEKGQGKRRQTEGGEESRE